MTAFEQGKRSLIEFTLTPVFRKVPEGYIGFVEELPGTNTQGDTLEEAQANSQEAIVHMLETNRARFEKALAKVSAAPVDEHDHL